MEPRIRVGIMFAPKISFCFNGRYRHIETGNCFEGSGEIVLTSNGVVAEIDGKKLSGDLPFNFEPVDYDNAYFELYNVTIGINFHWERQENQKFKGALRVIKEKDHLSAINILPIEDYLISVISSEMSATSSLEMLKAHSVISRSWLIAQIEKGESLKKSGNYSNTIIEGDEVIRWYDREDHQYFDVCADDHCQRYQGITRASTSEVEEAVSATSGNVLTYDGKICDARYSKCCGGVSELFENVWEHVSHPYLTKVIDADKAPEGYDMNLEQEDNSVEWIKGNPNTFCNTTDKEVLKQVLNDYDQETFDFYRWSVTLSQQKIKDLLKERVGIEVGDILDLIPVQRGVSSRLVKLKIEGSTGSVTIGKELEIRKAFSSSHLYSSAFVPEKGDIVDGVPQFFTLKGAGWGHGVGLCQIGAAVMGSKGYSYNEILNHYFKGASLTQKY
ncbi:SpoIID/LytB domain-containing protein [Marinilabiliaceae bacterium ANBcel2]|nr:SpoIID/LytB domain-containing protein [Marinilabiliaceae bacterium ANBcel2]